MLHYSRREAEKASSRNDCTVKRLRHRQLEGSDQKEGMTSVTNQEIYPLFSFSTLSLEAKLKITFRYPKMQTLTY